MAIEKVEHTPLVFIANPEEEEVEIRRLRFRFTSFPFKGYNSLAYTIFNIFSLFHLVSVALILEAQ
jgi:hypothetical protein